MKMFLVFGIFIGGKYLIFIYCGDFDYGRLYVVLCYFDSYLLKKNPIFSIYFRQSKYDFDN